MITPKNAPAFQLRKVQPRTTARKAGQYIQHIMKVGLLMACLTIGLPTTAFTNPEEPKGQTLKPLSNDSLTLNQCIAIALRNSHRVAITKGEISKAKINLKDARAGFLPEVYLSGGYTLNNIYDELEWNEKHYNLTLSASMSPFAGGRKLINVSNSKASLSVAQEGYRLTQASLVLDVTRKYYNLLKAEEIWRVKLHSLSQKRTHLDFAQTKYGLGIVPRADILKAEADVASAQVDSLQAKGNLELARAELNDAMGLSLDFPLKIKPVRFVQEKPPRLDSCLSQALSHRPELAQKRLTLTIMENNLKLVQIERWPSLSLTGSYNVYADKFVFGGVPVNRGNWDKNTDWRVGLALNFPIFDGGIRCRAIQEAEININEAKLNLEELEKEIKLEIKSAHLNLVTALKKVELTKKVVESAEESYNAALGRYKTGVAPITEVIDAEVALTNSKVNYMSAIYDYHLAKVILKKTIGSLF